MPEVLLENFSWHTEHSAYFLVLNMMLYYWNNLLVQSLVPFIYCSMIDWSCVAIDLCGSASTLFSCSIIVMCYDSVTCTIASVNQSSDTTTISNQK